MASADLGDGLLEFGVQIIMPVEALPRTMACQTIGHQLLRSGIAVGANYEEGQAAESHADFIHKLQISLKEIREANYWLRLLQKSGRLSHDRLASIGDESNQLRAMLSRAVAKAKGKAKPQARLQESRSNSYF
jgi:four helix bundle protein